MLAHVETPHTKLSIKGIISPLMIEVLKKEYGKHLILKEDDEERIPLEETEIWRDMQNDTSTPGENLRLLRKNRGLTQKQLGESIGVLKGRISEYERGVIAISKAVAKKLAKELGTSVEHFI